MAPRPSVTHHAVPPPPDAHDALLRLQDVTLAVSSALTPAEVGAVVLNHALALVGGRTAGMWVRERTGGALRVVHHLGWRPEHVPLFARLEPDSAAPPAFALRTGDALWLSSRAEYAAQFPLTEAAGRTDASSEELAIAVVPMRVDDEIVGVMSVSFDRALEIPRLHREVLLSLAHLSAQTLKRTELFEQVTRSNLRLAVLADVGEVLSSSLDYEETLRNVIRVCIPQLGDFGFFDVAEAGEVRRIALAHADPERQALLDGSRWVRSERTDVNLCALSSGKPALHPEIGEAWLRDVAVNDAHLAALRALRFGSMLTVPLEYEHELLGALTLFYDAGGRRHDADDEALATEVARRAAGALVNARLYADSRKAVRIRDDFLSVASHELRTPLTTVGLHIGSLLRALNANGPIDRDQLEARVSRTQLQLQRMNALVEQLLDVTRISAGRLELNPEDVDVAALAREVAGRFEHAARHAQCALVVRAPAELHAKVDPVRVDQILTNLLTNATKYGAGAPIELQLDSDEQFLQLRVTDQGIGIAAADQLRIFERFERASPVTNYGGLGLGLWIVRQLAHLHGGSVAVESAPGAGASFVVELPLAPET